MPSHDPFLAADHDSLPTNLLHVAPNPAGGWLIESEDGTSSSSSYSELDVAISEAEARASAHPGWKVVIHDEANPVAGDEANPVAGDEANPVAGDGANPVAGHEPASSGDHQLTA